MCVGDSVTASGGYPGYVQQALSRLYPDAGLEVVNRGVGGQKADGGVGILKGALA